MTSPHEVLIDINDVDQSFLPGGKFDPENETHIGLVIDKFRREGQADGYFTNVHFDGLVIQVSRSTEEEQELNDCIQLLKLGGYKPAIQRLEALLDKYPYHIDVLYNLGMALRESKHPQESINILTRATEAAPEHARSWVALAVSQQTVGNTEGALQAAQQAYALDPNDLYVQRTLAYLYEASGDADAAMPFLRKVLAHAPKDAQSHLVMGRIKMAKDPAGAMEHLELVKTHAPGSALAAQAEELLCRV